MNELEEITIRDARTAMGVTMTGTALWIFLSCLMAVVGPGWA